MGENSPLMAPACRFPSVSILCYRELGGRLLRFSQEVHRHPELYVESPSPMLSATQDVSDRKQRMQLRV